MAGMPKTQEQLFGDAMDGRYAENAGAAFRRRLSDELTNATATELRYNKHILSIRS